MAKLSTSVPAGAVRCDRPMEPTRITMPAEATRLPTLVLPLFWMSALRTMSVAIASAAVGLPS